MSDEDEDETSDARSARIHGRPGRTVRAIEKFNKHLSKKNRKAKYAKMAASPYALFRGTNHLYWRDFEWDWRLNRFGNHRTRTWLNGDCHAYNFGAYHVPGIGVVYGLNDFDEAIVADYQYDVWRLATSVVLIARENGDLEPSKQERAIESLAQAYLDSLRGLAGNRHADETVYSSRNTEGQLREFLVEVEQKTRRGMLKDWTHSEDGARRFKLSLKKLRRVSDSTYERIEQAMPDYVRTIRGHRRFDKRFFRVTHVAARLGAGTGSLGRKRYYVLIDGDRESRADDLILDVKLQVPPSSYPYGSKEQLREYRRHFRNEAVRHMMACQALAFQPDQLLGWMALKGKTFSVRERSPYKKAFDTTKLDSEASFVQMVEQWGRGLATEHARADKITRHSLAKEVGDLTEGRDALFRKVVREVAFGYADQVKEDWQIFREHLAPSSERRKAASGQSDGSGRPEEIVPESRSRTLGASDPREIQ